MKILNTCYVSVYRSTATTGLWPDDIGDDPSFSASLKLRGQITWGVCRPDVRKNLHPGDTVIFFARRTKDKQSLYYFTGFATVESKISQVEIWTQRIFAPYRRYGNLLIRGKAGDYRHFEPILPKSQWHANWLSRIVAKKWGKHKSIRRRQKTGSFSDRDPFVIGSNYIVFRSESPFTIILEDPPLVANAYQNGTVEQWKNHKFARALRKIIFKHTKRDGLRTTNRQHAHRHIKLANVAESIRDQILHLCSTHRCRVQSRDV